MLKRKNLIDIITSRLIEKKIESSIDRDFDRRSLISIKT